MSLESLIPMVNRWLEGVSTAMDSDISDNVDDGDELKGKDSEIPKGQNKTRFLYQSQRRNLLLRPKHSNKYLDVNQNEQDKTGGRTSSKRCYSTDDIPRVTPPDPDLLYSRDFFPGNFSHLKRESIDSTYVQRPFSPTPSLPSSEQLSLCEEEIVLLSPQFSNVLAQRRASDGMLLPHVNSSMNECDSVRSRASRPSSRYSNRPVTPASSYRLKTSGLMLPPISANAPNESIDIPSICLSEKSPSSSFRSSSESVSVEQPVFYPTPPSTPRTAIENKVGTCATRPRRSSLPNVLTSPKRVGLPIVKEENIISNNHGSEIPQPGPSILATPKRRMQRSKSLPNATLGSLSDWQKFKARQEDLGKEASAKLQNIVPRSFDDI